MAPAASSTAPACSRRKFLGSSRPPSGGRRAISDLVGHIIGPACGATRSIRPHQTQNKRPRCDKKLHENQSLNDAGLPVRTPRAVADCRRRVIQSAESRGGARSSPRLSSAWANNSASFGSFPEVSSVSRFSMQSIAARRAGRVSPWQDQPEICRAGSSIRLRKPRQEPAPSPWRRPGATAPCCRICCRSRRRPRARRRGPSPSGRPGRRAPGRAASNSPPGTVDFELGRRAFRLGRPAHDVPAAARGMPKDHVRSDFS